VASWISKAVLYGLVALLVGGAMIVGFQLYDPKAFTSLPSGRDPKLIGDWYTERFGQSRRYTFRRDGSGEMTGRNGAVRTFRWGTAGGTLKMVYRGFEGWQTPDFHYTKQANSDFLDFAPGDDPSSYPLALTRKAPASARIP
jgi:hypothetical protein